MRDGPCAVKGAAKTLGQVALIAAQTKSHSKQFWQSPWQRSPVARHVYKTNVFLSTALLHGCFWITLGSASDSSIIVWT